MENYQISRPCGRPYNATCGMAREMTGNQTGFYRCAQRSPSSSPSSSCTTVSGNSEMYSPIEHLPIAMAYVPCQKFSTTYDLNYANPSAESEVSDDDESEFLYFKRETPSTDL